MEKKSGRRSTVRIIVDLPDGQGDVGVDDITSDVVVGVLCDSEMVKYNRFPLKSTGERVELVKSIPNVKQVIIQDDIMYDNVVKELRPNYIIHGDNWVEDSMKVIKKNILTVFNEYGGELIEVPYTFSSEVQKTDRQMREKLAMPELRRARLRQLLKMVPVVKTIEVHSGLTGLIAEKTVIAEENHIDQFEAMWISSLCDSTEKGKPDIELVDMTSRFRTINDIMEVTTKPIIFDGDTGGIAEHFVYTVRSTRRQLLVRDELPGVGHPFIDQDQRRRILLDQRSQGRSGIGPGSVRIRDHKNAKLF